MEQRGRTGGALMQSLTATHANAAFNPSAARPGPPPAVVRPSAARAPAPSMPVPMPPPGASRGSQPPPRITPPAASARPPPRPAPAYAPPPTAGPSRVSQYSRPPPRPPVIVASYSAIDTSQDGLRLQQDTPAAFARSSIGTAENSAVQELLQGLPADFFDVDFDLSLAAVRPVSTAAVPSVTSAASEDAQVIALKQTLEELTAKCRSKEAEANWVRNKMKQLDEERKTLEGRVATVAQEERAQRVAEVNRLEGKIRELEMAKVLADNLNRPRPESDRREVLQALREKEAAEKREAALRAEKEALQRQFSALQQHAASAGPAPVASVSITSAPPSTVTTSALALGSTTSTPVSVAAPSLPARPVSEDATWRRAAVASVLGANADCYYYLVDRGPPSLVWRCAAVAFASTLQRDLTPALHRVGGEHVYTLLSQLQELRVEGDETPAQRGEVKPVAARGDATSPVVRSTSILQPVAMNDAPGVAAMTTALSPGILRQRRALFGGYALTGAAAAHAVQVAHASSSLMEAVNESAADASRAVLLERHLLEAAGGASIAALLDTCVDIVSQRADATGASAWTPAIAAALLLRSMLLADPTAAHQSVHAPAADECTNISAPDAVMAVVKRRMALRGDASSRRPSTLDALLHASTACSAQLRSGADRVDAAGDMGPLLLRHALVDAVHVTAVTQSRHATHADLLLHCLRGMASDCNTWSAGLVTTAACLHLPGHDQTSFIQARVLGSLVLPGAGTSGSAASRRVSMRDDNPPTMTAAAPPATAAATPRGTLMASGNNAGSTGQTTHAAAAAHSASILLHRTLLSLHTLQDTLQLLSALQPMLATALTVPTDAVLLSSGATTRHQLEAVLSRTACCRVLACFSEMLAATGIEFIGASLLTPMPTIRAEDVDWSSGVDAASRHITTLMDTMQHAFAARIVQLQVATHAARVQAAILTMIASLAACSGVRGVGILFGGCNLRIPAAHMAAAAAAAGAEQEAPEDDGVAHAAAAKRARVVMLEGDAGSNRRDTAAAVVTPAAGVDVDASGIRAGKRTNRSGVASFLPAPKPTAAVTGKSASGTSSTGAADAAAAMGRAGPSDADGDVVMNLQVSEPHNSALLPRIALVAVARVRESCRLRAALEAWPATTSRLDAAARDALQEYAIATTAAGTAALSVLRCYPKLLDVLRAHVELLGDKPHLRHAASALVNMCASIMQDVQCAQLGLEQPQISTWCSGTVTQATAAAEVAAARATPVAAAAAAVHQSGAAASPARTPATATATVRASPGGTMRPAQPISKITASAAVSTGKRK